MNQRPPTEANFRPFPKSFKGVKISPADLEVYFRAGKTLKEIAAIYGIRKHSLMAKIRNSLSLSEAMRQGKADFEKFG